LAQISGNGRYLLFNTTRPLARGDRNKLSDLYRFELATGALRRVSVDPIRGKATDGPLTGSMSHNGQVIAYLSEERLVRKDRREDGFDVYVRDMRQRRPQLVSQSTSGAQAWTGSTLPEVSGNGRYVLFTTRSRNLVRRDTNGQQDLFVRDLRAGTTKRVSVNSREQQTDRHAGYGSISDDGRFVLFPSRATNLAPGTTDFGGGTRSGEANFFLRDRHEGTTTAITMAPDGTGANDVSTSGVISHDGSTVVFFSYASNLIDGVDGQNVFLRRLNRTGS
jgi:TolB protein